MKLLDTSVLIFSITPEIAVKAARIGTTLIPTGEEIGVNDTYLAATAVVHDLTLLTADVGSTFQKDWGIKSGRVVSYAYTFSTILSLKFLWQKFSYFLSLAFSKKSK